MAVGFINYSDRHETYINNTFPNALQYYENVVTQESNDYFVVSLDDGVEKTAPITVNSENDTHEETEASNDTPSVQQMNETSLASDQRPKQSDSSNSWIPLWLLLK